MITSPQNPTLKLVRKLRQRRWRERLDMFVAEGEDLVEAGKQARWELVHELHAGRDVAPELLAAVSDLASGTRVLAIFRRRWAAPDARPLRLFLDGVRDPGNVGSCLRSAYALGDAQVVLAPGSADPFAPKAVRASMGALFHRPPALAPEPPAGRLVVLDAHGSTPLWECDLTPPLTLCVGAERTGVTPALRARADEVARIPVRGDSLNVAMAATVALYEANRMATRERHA